MNTIKENMNKGKIMLKFNCLTSAGIWLFCSVFLFAGHPTGKLVMLDINVGRISSTEPISDTHLNLTEFINDGFNGIHIRLWGGEDKDRQWQVAEEMQEAGMWIGAWVPGQDLATIKKSALQIINRWHGHVDFMQIDEPFESSGGCHARDWLKSEADYLALKQTIDGAQSNVPLIITDVYCNSLIWNWNIDGLVQEVYGEWMYPDYLNKVKSWSAHSGKPGYVWLNVFNKQLYNKCADQPESMFKTWMQASWDANIKMLFFLFANRCDDCVNADCQNFGNDWPSIQRVTREVTAGTRVKFHEWRNFNPEGIHSLTPDVTVQVRSEEAGLKPSTVKCYYTTDYNGRWETEPGKPTNTTWTETPCTCTTNENNNSKGWETITATNVPFDPAGDNRIRFKIRDWYSGNYYRGPRWGRQEYAVEIDSNLVMGNKYPEDILLSNNIVAYDAAAGETIAIFSTVDPDSADTSFTYAFASGGADNHMFDIQGNVLKAFSSTGYDTTKTYTILVETKDATGWSFTKELTIKAGLETPTALQFNKSIAAFHADKVDVIDLQGRVVLELDRKDANGQLTDMAWSRLINESGLQMGVYVVRSYNGNVVESRKVFKK
ncbi:MAG: T9SS type A sorting domain-containing protein [Fibrobacteria bacterium]|nr:T9SS type A sorting domain-containing protein [Fibrobacteria bacterium]